MLAALTDARNRASEDQNSISKAELDDFLDHANWDCANRGNGIWLKPDHQHSSKRLPHVVFVSWTWSETEALLFRTTRSLPVALNSSELSPYTPCLLVKIMRAGNGPLPPNGFPSFVSGLELDKGPLPCLYLIRCGKQGLGTVSRSHVLVPEEFIDFDYRNKKYAERMRKIGMPAANVSSAREVVEKVGEGKGNQIVQDADLRELITVPFSELTVRAGRDHQDAVEAFLAAHANKSKALTWSTNLKISATGDYVVTLNTLERVLAGHKNGALGTALKKGGGDGDAGGCCGGDDIGGDA